MAEKITSNQALSSLHAALDPKSLILSQFPDLNEPQFLQLTTENVATERGPRYKEYSDLRDKKLQKKKLREETPEKEENLTNRSILTPPKKQVKFSASSFVTPPRKPKSTSILTQSVPDFTSALRKENRKPAAGERLATPPAGLPKSGRMYGSKSTNSADKRSGGLMARKSYASMEELKGLSCGAGNAINGGGRSGRRCW